MRTTIRLTGRKELPRSATNIRLLEAHEKKYIALSIVQPEYFSGFPPDSMVKVRLVENKSSETLKFGRLDSLDVPRTAELEHPSFSAPSCQLRVVAGQSSRKGILLASTKRWTLRDDSDPDDRVQARGILMFQSSKVHPRVWRLEIREDEFPVVYVDSSIPNVRTWVRNDPVFIGCVLPSIIREVFEDILAQPDPSSHEWMEDWLSWAESLMPGVELPDPEARDTRLEWIDHLLDCFCTKHDVRAGLLSHLEGGHRRG